jgi:hypothetical protein
VAGRQREEQVQSPAASISSRPPFDGASDEPSDGTAAAGVCSAQQQSSIACCRDAADHRMAQEPCWPHPGVGRCEPKARSSDGQGFECCCTMQPTMQAR